MRIVLACLLLVFAGCSNGSGPSDAGVPPGLDGGADGSADAGVALFGPCVPDPGAFEMATVPTPARSPAIRCRRASGRS